MRTSTLKTSLRRARRTLAAAAAGVPLLVCAAPAWASEGGSGMASAATAATMWSLALLGVAVIVLVAIAALRADRGEAGGLARHERESSKRADCH